MKYLLMSTNKTGNRYDEDFKRTLVNLYQSGGKSQAALCNVNRSTYYKHFNSEPAVRTKQNQLISKLILQIYADYNKRLGAYKITYILQRDYGILISVGRVYRLMKTLQLPCTSTDKPFLKYRHKENGECTNHLQQEFNQKCPNIVRASDFTYIKVAGKWLYLCIVMDLFSRKVISWNISPKPDVDLVMTAFKKAYEKRNHPEGLMFHSDRGSQYTASSFRQLLDSLLTGTTIIRA